MQPTPGPPPQWPAPPPGWAPPPMAMPMSATRPRGPRPATLAVAIASVVLLFGGLFGSCLLSMRSSMRELEERSAFFLQACGEHGHSMGCASVVAGNARDVQHAHEAVVHWERQLGAFAEITDTKGAWLHTDNGATTGRILVDVRFGDTTKPVQLGYRQQDDVWMLESFIVDPSAADLRD